MTILFPKLDSLVNKDAKLNDDNIMKYVHVVQNHAIVINSSIVIVDLREYVKTECEITEDFESLDRVLEFFNGKSFTPDVWKEFTNKSEVHLTEDMITLDSLNYSKTIYFDEPPVVINNVLEILLSNLNRDDMEVSNFAVNFNELTKIISCFKKEMKGLSLNLKTKGQDVPVLFQASKKDYIFGLIPLSYDDASDILNFMKVKEFYDKLSNSIME